MKQEIIQQGAEATIYKIGKEIVKERLPKNYRLKELDDKIRIRRTKKEKKLLAKASEIINSPKPKESKDKTKIIMPYIPGNKLSENLDKLKNNAEICKEIGKNIAKLHDNEIIHGDLTTSNLILHSNKVWFIDFGLGFVSNKIEDKAVDLHLIKQALEAKHYKNHKIYWKNILVGYKISKNYSLVLERLKQVESRGRYKVKY